MTKMKDGFKNGLEEGSLNETESVEKASGGFKEYNAVSAR